MENTQTNHQLLAIRLRWLNWLSKPIVAIWNFIVESVSYVWTIIKLAWAGMKESINYRYWLIGTIGGSISVFLVLLFYFIGIQVREPTFFLIGAVLSILPIAWTYAEIANLIQYKKQNGNDIELKSMKSALGNGLNAIKFFALYVATIVTMVIAQVVLDLLGLIPTVGPTFLGIIALPLVVASLLIIFSVLILSFGTPILGAHLLTETAIEGSLFSRFTNSSISLIKIISKKWLEVILVSLPATIFGLLVTVLPAVLIGSSIALSTGIAVGVAEDTVTRLMSIVSSYSNPGVFEYVGGFFLAISFSILVGFVLSFYLSSFACTYNSIYNHRNDKSFSKKIFGLLFIFLFIPLLLGLWNVIYYEFFRYGW
jgi:hypothetical protein